MQNLPRWDLSSLFKNEQDAKQSLTKKARESKAFAQKYAEKVSSLKPTEILTALSEYEIITDELHAIGTYAYLRYVTDMSSESTTAFYQYVNDEVSEIGAVLAFFTLELNACDDATVNNSVLAKYLPFLKDVRAFKPYELSRELEEFIVQKNLTSNAWVRFYDETLASLRFNIGGKNINISKAVDLLSHKDRKVREEASHEIAKVFKENIRTFTFIMNTLIKDKSIDDKTRGFESPISSRNLANFVEDNIVDSLISSVSKSYEKTSHRYYRLKAKMLGFEKMEYWDRNAPLPFGSDKSFSYDEAQKIVLEAYSEFSPQMAEIGKKFFDNNWIDAPAVENKDSGAFSHPCAPSRNPFIMLNYLGKARDVATLAHELGHGVHQYLARKQGALMAGTSLTLSETASVFGEQLVFQKLLKTLSGKERLAFLCSKIEDGINTAVRQIAFCKFESALHDARKDGELSSDDICKAWMAVQSESLGDSINFIDEYKFYWCYISHFIHSPFYVYAYAFGEILVNSLYSIKDKVPNFAEKYIDLLSAGGSKRHKEILEPFGVDLSDPSFWNLNTIEDMIIEAEKTFESL